MHLRFLLCWRTQTLINSSWSFFHVHRSEAPTGALTPASAAELMKLSSTLASVLRSKTTRRHDRNMPHQEGSSKCRSGMHAAAFTSQVRRPSEALQLVGSMILGLSDQLFHVHCPAGNGRLCQERQAKVSGLGVSEGQSAPFERELQPRAAFSGGSPGTGAVPESGMFEDLPR